MAKSKYSYFLIRKKKYIFVGMKFFCTIFAAYLLFLTVLPCIDSKIMKKSSKAQITSLQLEEDHSNYQPDLCSPLCICNCCGGITILIESQPAFDVIHFSERCNVFPEKKTSSISFSVWQPPKA